MAIPANSGQASASKARITIERSYPARIEDVWAMWTTREGIESWWGPGGFTVNVRSIDLRPRGELRYAMTATGTAQVEFMKKAGMPLSNEHRVIYTEVVPPSRLGFSHLVDFVPGIEPYDVAVLVELYGTTKDVRVVLTIDRMHDEIWTERAVAGWEAELGKLAKVLERTFAAANPTRQQVVVERTYRARIEELWDLWTTREGFQSWWGPDGFRVEVFTLEPRVGGTLHYDMIADAPGAIEAMAQMGRPLSHEARGRFTEMRPYERLAITHVIDFLPGVQPYESTMVVEFFASDTSVRMVVTLDPMHDEEFTRMSTMGFASQLTKLDRRFGVEV
jgi:uncharacterized protein YndB with AHSA1/START domain